MSGGSYNYLFTKETRTFALGNSDFQTIDSMKERLEELDYINLAELTGTYATKVRNLFSQYLKLDGELVNLRSKWSNADEEDYWKDEIRSFNLDNVIDNLYLPSNYNDMLNDIIKVSTLSDEDTFATMVFKQDVTNLIKNIDTLEEEISDVRDVWHAVEWYDSMDSGIDAVQNAVEKFNSKLAAK